MTKREHIEYWLKSAEKDWETMKFLLKGKRYVHALFFGHLYLEKISKALWITQNKENYPPKIHNLLTILKHTNAGLTEEQQLFLLKLNQYQIEGRYPEDVEKLYKFTNKKLADEYLKQIKTIGTCLLKRMPS